MLSATLLTLIAAPRPWTLVAGGDMMFYAMNPKKAAVEALAPVFSKADVAYANLEIPLTAAKRPTSRKTAAELKARTQFVLKADPAHIKQIQALGLDLVSLANNHAMDFGNEGLDETQGLLDKAGIAHSGGGKDRDAAESVAVKILPNGLRIGMVSYLAFVGTRALSKCTPATAESAGIAALDLGGVLNDKTRARLRNIVLRARKQSDVVLVALHWGIERQSKPTPYQINLGRAFIDAGADAVLGAHPHTLQGREIYKNKPILYSMGNLISPLPAQSAVYTLKFDGRAFKNWSLRPMQNSAGKASWLSKSAEPRRLREILALDALIPRPKPSKPADKPKS